MERIYGNFSRYRQHCQCGSYNEKCFAESRFVSVVVGNAMIIESASFNHLNGSNILIQLELR